ncbi:MAG: hypothetical protein ABIQ07_06570 [Ginsengibacter sp.]
MEGIFAAIAQLIKLGFARQHIRSISMISLEKEKTPVKSVTIIKHTHIATDEKIIFKDTTSVYYVASIFDTHILQRKEYSSIKRIN